MKNLIYLLITVLFISVFISCEEDEDNPSPFTTITLGAQDNTTTGGFYSFNEEKVYTMSEAFSNQAAIDLLCFYDSSDSITISSPGANITGIFSGDNSPENWDVTNTTYLYQVDPQIFGTDEFSALSSTDAIIETLYNTDQAKRKAKDLKVDQIFAFKRQNNQYGLFKVLQVINGNDGSIKIEYIIKE